MPLHQKTQASRRTTLCAAVTIDDDDDDDRKTVQIYWFPYKNNSVCTTNTKKKIKVHDRLLGNLQVSHWFGTFFFLFSIKSFSLWDICQYRPYDQHNLHHIKQRWVNSKWFFVFFFKHFNSVHVLPCALCNQITFVQKKKRLLPATKQHVKLFQSILYSSALKIMNNENVTKLANKTQCVP